MQKLELRNNLNDIINNLLSRQIVNLLTTDKILSNNLLMMIVDSKGGYDKAISDVDKAKVFKEFETEKIYETHYFSTLISFISTIPANQNHRSQFLSHTGLNDFYSFHKSLLSTFRLVDNLLIGEKDIFDSNKNFDIHLAENNGNLILEVIDDGLVSLSKLNEIISSIEKLTKTIYLLYDKIENEKFDIYPQVAMIDSGSDVNIVIKLPSKAANLISQVIKQFWEYVSAHKSYKYRQTLKDVEKTITVLGKIKEAEDKKLIEPEMSAILKKGILENVEDIIAKNTLTKQIVIEGKEISNRQLLLERSKELLLEAGKTENPQ
ncbi:MAG: hypothetical protein HY841_12305 [Bacteroidetes bacterium]|nr:hypothetical protein [Bacteroidota bacterium]